MIVRNPDSQAASISQPLPADGVEQHLVDANALVGQLQPPDWPDDPLIDAVPFGALRQVPIDPCLVCGSKRAFERFLLPEMQSKVVACTDCGLGMLHPRPSALQIERFYPLAYYHSAGAEFTPRLEKLARWAARWYAWTIGRRLKRGSRALDVGCGRGVLLHALAERGFETHGFEISPAAVRGVDERAKIRIASDLEAAGYPAGHFDLVVLSHVLEHLSDPRRTLLEVHRILKPGGRIAVAVPNFDSPQAHRCGRHWFHLDLPRHLYHFPLPALRKLLKKTGFECRCESHFSLRHNPFGWVQSSVNRVGIWPRNSLYSLLKHNAAAMESELSWLDRFVLRTACYTGLPIALFASLVMALRRRGATVTVVAEAVADSQT